MPKRFTATEKWLDPWFCALQERDRFFWIYILDNCDHAGIWQVNPLLIETYFPGYIVEARKFGDRVEVLTDQKWYISKFVEFQYGKLNPASNVHSSVLKRLKKERVAKGFTKGSPTLKAKDKDKDKDVVKDLDVKVKDVYAPALKVKYSEFVYLLPEEYEKLRTLMGNLTQEFIMRLDGYIGQIGPPKAAKKYVSHYHTILNWYRKDKAEGKYASNGGTGISEYAAIARRAREAMGVREPIAPPRAISPGVRNLPDVPHEAKNGSGDGQRGDVQALAILRTGGFKIKPAGP